MNNIRILIAEDEDRMRELLKIYIEKEGFGVDEASDGDEALQKLKSNEYSMVLLDVMMPVIDGWTVCREIRKLSSVPVIMITARAEEYDKLYGFELGVDDYIVKPFSPKEVIARMKAILKRSPSIHQINLNSQVVIGNIKVDDDSKQVYVDNKEILLTPKEYDLFLFFIKNKNKVFSREQLLKNVWGYDFFGDARTVDTHIKQLREKVGKNNNFIKTVWGTGYKFSLGD